MRSSTIVDGYFGSTLCRGTGAATFPAWLATPERCNSEKWMIQLPVALLKFGMLTFIEYTRRREKICSGCAPGGRRAKFGGPVRTESSSTAAFGSGRLMYACGFAMLNFPTPPRPETLEFGFGFPPLITIPVAFAPPALLLAASEFPPLDAEDAGGPPDAPSFLPSGEIATRADKLPSGTGTAGAGGAGEAERAIRVPVEPAGAFDAEGATSGAAASSPSCFRAPSRGVEPALISTFGFAGPFCWAIRLTSEGLCSRFGKSGEGTSVVATVFFVFGRSSLSVRSLISRRGRGGTATEARCTMLGMSGKLFGASSGAAGFTRVCRGCVGREGSVQTRWRGGNGRAPPAGGGSAGVLARGAACFSRGMFRSGRSSTGPDQVNCVLSNAGLRFADTCRSGHGISSNRICARAASRMARRGAGCSTRQSRSTYTRGTPPVRPGR